MTVKNHGKPIVMLRILHKSINKRLNSIFSISQQPLELKQRFFILLFIFVSSFNEGFVRKMHEDLQIHRCK